MEVGIVGYGYVGKATEKQISNATIKISDPKKGYNDDLSRCDIIFISINETNATMDNLERLMDTLTETNQIGFFVIRTTVIPGTTDYLATKYNRKIVFMPEFLREWNYEYDAKNPDKVVIGTEDNGLFNILKILCYSNNTIQVKPIEAELAKLALNSLAVIKVVFAEELADLSNVLNCEYKNIYKIFSLDQNVNIRHLESYKDGYKGADGKCLPKDSEFLVKTGELYNSRMSLLETAVTINKFMLRVR
jgi:UDPglucose 6-dehydrogenase